MFWQSILRHIKKIDWGLILIVLLLSGISVLFIYSTSLSEGNFLNLKKQIIFLSIGFVLMLLISFFDWRVLAIDSHLVLILYFICLVSLAGLFFFAPDIRGVKGWYKIGEISVDPIEFTKIVLIVLLAKYFSMRHIEMYRVRHILFSGFYILLPAVLVFLQPDLGQVLILISLWIGILIVSGIEIRHFLVLIFCFILIAVSGWSFLLKDYQKERIIGFLVPGADPLGISWSQIQSKIAIGAGGIWGKGFGKGSQTQYHFLPEAQTDFIFAAIAEETGICGVSFLLLLFLLLFWRIIKIGVESEKNFPRLFVSGFSIILISQIFIHIGMNLGILPIIGIPLPLISYGGSGLISMFIGFGILQSIKTH